MASHSWYSQFSPHFITRPTGNLYQVQKGDDVHYKLLLLVTSQSINTYGGVLSKQNLPSGLLLVANNSHHRQSEWYMCAVLVVVSRWYHHLQQTIDYLRH